MVILKKKLEAANDIHRALLIEDDVCCQKVQGCYLMELGYQVEIAPDAKTAIQQVINNIYDLIVLDLGLPDQSGEKVITAARSYLPNQQTPLIVTTAHADATMQKRCLCLGADRVFIKPLAQKSLAQAIDFCHSRFFDMSQSIYR
jgi:DNA-binding response OmpR family regulator